MAQITIALRVSTYWALEACVRFCRCQVCRQPVGLGPGAGWVLAGKE